MCNACPPNAVLLDLMTVLPRVTKEALTKYDESPAWPALFDDFVESLKKKAMLQE